MKNSKQTVFYLVRHGQTDWNHFRKVQGHRDIPLNDFGRLEALKLAEELNGTLFSACYSSDLKRAYETAQILTANQTLEIYTDQRLRERHYGSWEGELYQKIDSAAPEQKKDVESDQSMKERVFTSLLDMMERYTGETILVVTHGGIIRNVILELLALHEDHVIKPQNTAVLQISHSETGWNIQNLQGIPLS